MLTLEHEMTPKIPCEDVKCQVTDADRKVYIKGLHKNECKKKRAYLFLHIILMLQIQEEKLSVSFFLLVLNRLSSS